ncbi:hypothetical protein H8959_013041 [Pygathrix nigripes]
MRLGSPGLLLLLFSSLRADPQEKEVRAMVGSDVELSCACPEGSRFDLNDVYVYWQTSESKTVVTYHIPQNSSLDNVDSHYRNRALMSPAGMRQGDFSLRLFNVTPQDEQKFHCLVLSQSLGFQEVLSIVVTLHVAVGKRMEVGDGGSARPSLFCSAVCEFDTRSLENKPPSPASIFLTAVLPKLRGPDPGTNQAPPEFLPQQAGYFEAGAHSWLKIRCKIDCD